MARRTAILAGIYANLEALDAVLQDAADAGCDRVVCLGGILDYGPDPVACVDRLREAAAWCLRGIAEWRLLELIRTGGKKMNAGARASSERHRRLLEPASTAGMNDRKRWEWIARLEPQREEGDCLYAHGSPADPEFGWMDEYRGHAKDFERVPGIAFLGMPRHGWAIRSSGTRMRPTTEGGFVHVGKDEKAIVNVGSVGQPGDDCPKSFYVIHEDRQIEFRRVTYDIEKTRQKILADPDLRSVDAERLRLGR